MGLAEHSMVPMTLPTVITQAMDVITDPSYSRSMDPDTAFSRSSSPDVTMAPIAA